MTLDDFAGTWRIERQIEDRHLARSGTLKGSAVFTPDSEGLRYTEEGTLRFPGQPDLSAKQSYLWRADNSGVEVQFVDGRPFHQFALGQPSQNAHHDCPPDSYTVHYTLSDWPVWRTVWQVSGPRKDYTMSTLYIRNIV